MAATETLFFEFYNKLDVEKLREEFQKQIPQLKGRAWLNPVFLDLEVRGDIICASVAEDCVPIREVIGGEVFIRRKRELALRWRMQEKLGAWPEPDCAADMGAHHAYGDAPRRFGDMVLRKFEDAKRLRLAEKAAQATEGIHLHEAKELGETEGKRTIYINEDNMRINTLTK